MTGPRRITRAGRLFFVGTVVLLGPGLLSAGAQDFATLEATAGQVTVLRLGQPQPAGAVDAASARRHPGHAAGPRQRSLPLRRHRAAGRPRVAGPDRRERHAAGHQALLRAHLGARHPLEGAADPVQQRQHHRRHPRHRAEPRRRQRRQRDAAVRPGGPAFDAQTDAGSRDLDGGPGGAGRPRAARRRSPLRARPLDAVQWALYYQPVLYRSPARPRRPRAPPSAPPPSSPPAASRTRPEGPRRGPEGEPERRRRARPEDDRRAWRPNRRDAALTTAQKAVAADPKSATARSRALVRAAGALRPRGRAGEPREGGEARARRTRWHGRGCPSCARPSATWTRRSRRRRRRRRSQPNLARTQTVLGFAHLTQVNTGRGDGGLREGDRARLGRPAAAARPRPREDPRGRPRRRARGHRDRREPRPDQRPRPQLPGQGLLRGEARPASSSASRRSPSSSTRTTRPPGSTTRSGSRRRTGRSRRCRTSRSRSS